MPRLAQEIAGLIKGLLTTIVPYLGLNKALFPAGGGIGGVPLDSHDIKS